MDIFSNNLVHAVQKFGDIFPKDDCYMSLTNPTQYVEISHFFPTGPLHILIKFQIEIFLLKNAQNTIKESFEIPFFRVNQRCHTTITLATRTQSFEKMDVLIDIYLFNSESRIAQFLYYFKIGFTSGRHILLSYYKTFGIVVKVDYQGDEYLPSVESEFIINWQFLQFHINTYNDICVVMDYDRGVIIRPDFVEDKPLGFTSFIYAIYQEEGKIPYEYQIPAFDCFSEERDPNQFVVFFDEHPAETKIMYLVKRIYINDSDRVFKFALIKLPQIRRENINNLNLFKNIKKVFFIENLPEVEILPKNIIKMYFKTNMGYIHRSYMGYFTDVMFNIARYQRINLI